MKLLLICMLGFLSAFFGCIALERLLTQKKRKIRLRMENVRHLKAERTVTGAEKSGGRRTALHQAAAVCGAVLERRGIIKPLEEKMLQADIPLRGGEYLFIWFLAAFIPGLLVLLATRSIISGLFFSAAGFIIPPLLVKRAQQKKVKKFNLQLVDALSVISNSLRAGYSFMQALELAGREMPHPIGKEFARTFREVNLGTTMEEALGNLGRRITSEDLDLIITAVLIQRQIGGNLAGILDNISTTITERVRIQGEIKTLTAQGKISGLVIGLIPIFLIIFMLLINPAYLMPLFHSQAGLFMLGAGITAECIGIVVIKKIITVDI